MGTITQKLNLSFLKIISLILLATVVLLFFLYDTPKNEEGYLERIHILENKTNTNVDNATLYKTIKETIISLIDTYKSDDYEEVENTNDYDDYDVENKSIKEMIDDYESNEEVSTMENAFKTQIINSTSDDNINDKNTKKLTPKKQLTTDKKLSEKELDKIWLTKMENRFERRRVTLKNGCKKLKSTLNYSVNRTLQDNIYMDKKYDLLVCVVAKAGSSTWKTHLLKINGQSFTGHVHSSSDKIRAGSLLSLAGVKDRMQNNAYTRVMNARHPLDRLVSAYRDKYNDGGLKIQGNFLQVAAEHLYKSEKDLKRISFQDFLKIVIRNQLAGYENAHWRNYYRTCSPCQLTYDYVMMVETYSEDLSYIFRKLGVTEIDPELRRHGLAPASEKSKYEKYYEDIPEDILRKIHQLYKEDYELFGYDVPKFIQRVL